MKNGRNGKNSFKKLRKNKIKNGPKSTMTKKNDEK